MPNAYPALQGELLINPLPSSPSIFLLRPVPVGEVIVGATSATPNADVKPLPANASQLKSVMEQERQRGGPVSDSRSEPGMTVGCQVWNDGVIRFRLFSIIPRLAAL